MGLQFGTRASDSPWISSVWTCRSGQDAEMTSVASETWGLVFGRQQGRVFASVTGAESRTGTAPVPAEATFVGIEFAVGTALRTLPGSVLLDGGIDLPDIDRRSFRLDDHRWPIPGPDDAEALVDLLVRRGAIVRDPVVTEALRGGRPAVTDRTLERRFRTATGLRQGAVRQIERVRAAAVLLSDGTAVNEVVGKLGYYDEPHLARALRRYVGRTAGQLRAGTGGTIGLDLAQRTTS